jgi:hypothetical protein
MAPWIENLNFVALWDTGWSERLLKSMYYVTWKHGDQFPDEIEKLWSTVAHKPRNIIPVLDFLITKGIEDYDSQVMLLRRCRRWGAQSALAADSEVQCKCKGFGQNLLRKADDKVLALTNWDAS